MKMKTSASKELITAVESLVDRLGRSETSRRCGVSTIWMNKLLSGGLVSKSKIVQLEKKIMTTDRPMQNFSTEEIVHELKIRFPGSRLAVTWKDETEKEL